MSGVFSHRSYEQQGDTECQGEKEQGDGIQGQLKKGRNKRHAESLVHQLGSKIGSPKDEQTQNCPAGLPTLLWGGNPAIFREKGGQAQAIQE